jgi:secreted protein with Ig-like and vWFA domain
MPWVWIAAGVVGLVLIGALTFVVFASNDSQDVTTVTLYANGEELTAVDDATLRPRGKIGLGGALFEANQKATFEFDNLIVTTPP